jgi:large exoprotein involved in heme utilization and adhesion
VTVTGGGLIQSGSEFDPQGGNIAITANSLTISNGSGVSSQALIQDVGSVSVTAKTLTIDNGYISTSTLEAGRAGDIALNVVTLSLTNGGQIATSSVNAPGTGGDLSIAATGSVYISGSSPTGSSPLPSPFGDLINDARSGLFSTASGTGPGGIINVQTPDLKIVHNGVISAKSSGTDTATAGDINIVVNQFNIDNGSITTEALVADGGNISITANGSQLNMTESQITTSVESGFGSGGNITIGLETHPFDFITLNNSGIHANAFGGPGGNINIFADVFLSSLPISTAVTASSKLSTPGIIQIQAQITDVSGRIAPLPETPLQAEELLRALCAERLAGGKTSSLALGGRGGLPLEPGGLLPSPLYPVGPFATSSVDQLFAKERASSSPPQFSLFESGNERLLTGMGQGQLQLVKTRASFGCSD